MNALYTASVSNVFWIDSRNAAGGTNGTLVPAVPPPQAAPSTILELEGIKVTCDLNNPKEEPFYRIHTSKCKSWLYPVCRVGKGLALKESLMNKAYLFKQPRLYTITVNREWFKNPAEA